MACHCTHLFRVESVFLLTLKIANETKQTTYCSPLCLSNNFLLGRKIQKYEMPFMRRTSHSWKILYNLTYTASKKMWVMTSHKWLGYFQRPAFLQFFYSPRLCGEKIPSLRLIKAIHGRGA